VITTNDERDLPAAFLRRCIVHTIKEPEDKTEKLKRLKDIAKLHMTELIQEADKDGKLVEQIAAKCLELRAEARGKSRRGPSIAEFLDAVRFCLARGLNPETEIWKLVQDSVLLKDSNLP
jgi:MoxR-like ATPase